MAIGRDPGGDLLPMPIRKEWVLAGDPVATGRVVVATPDGARLAGRWNVTPGRFRWDFTDHDEMAWILDGLAVVRGPSGERWVLTAGVYVHFPRGLSTEWMVERTLSKCFFLVTPT